MKKSIEKLELLWVLIGTGFGIGYIKIASGTFASLLGIIIYLLIYFVTDSTAFYITYFLLLLLLTPISTFVAGYLEKHIFKQKDPHPVVIDEIVGYLFALAFIRTPDLQRTFIYVTVAFFLFRFFDIIKPPPIRQSQKLHSGWGIVTDDILAGLFCLPVFIIWQFF